MTWCPFRSLTFSPSCSYILLGFLAPPPRILHISSGISLPLGLPCSATLAPGHWPPSLPRYPFNLALTFHRYSALLSRSPASGSPHSHFSCSLSTGFLPLLFPRQPVNVKQNMIFFPFPPSLSSLVLHLLLQLLPTRPCSLLLHYHLTTYLSYVM